MSSNPVTLDFSKAQPIDFSKYAQPAKLDMSTYEPLPGQPVVTLDFSKAQLLPGQPTTPPNSFTGQWNPQTQQWEDAEPNTVATQGPTERFARSFNKGVTGAEDPSHFLDNLKQMASQTASDVADEISNRPVQAIAAPLTGLAGIPGSQRILQGIYTGMKQTWDRASEELKNGNITSKEGLLNYVNGLIHAVESGVPVAGPMLSDADKELGAGNVAGAAGTVSSLAAPALMGAEGGNLEADTGTVTNPAATPASSPGNIRSTAAKYARSAADFVDPDFTGVISPRLAHAQRLMGKVANALENQSESTPTPAPAPAPQTVQLPEGSWSGSVRNPAPVEGQAGAQIPASTAVRTAAPPAQVGLQSTAGAIAPASEDEVAQGLGYTSAIQAQQHVGPDVWRQTYQKIAQSDVAQRQAAQSTDASTSVAPQPASQAKETPTNINDVIDQAIAPSGDTRALNLRTKGEVDFYVQKGDVAAAKNALQKATEKAQPKASPAPGSLADLQEDQAIQASARNDAQKLWARGRLVEGREQAAGNSADRTKVAGDPTQGEQFATRWSRYPLPEADLEANRMVGYDPNGLPQPYRVEAPDPDMQPWGGLPADNDLTAILQRSVELAKRRKAQVGGK